MATQKDKSRKNDLIDRSRDILSGISLMTGGAFWMAASDHAEILYLSPAVEKIYGLPICDIHRNPRLWFESTHPDDRRHTQEKIAECNGSPYEIERRIMRPNGATIWVLDRVFPVKDERGAVSHIIGFSEDITERKNRENSLLESERRYRALIETSTDGIAVIQGDKMVFLNDLLIERTGFSREELSAASFHQFVHPDDSKMVVERYTNRLKSEASAGSIEFRVLTKDKKVIYTEINAASTHWGGEPALLCFFRDVTEKKLAEQLIKESEERYRDLVENIEDIIYIVDDQGEFLFANEALVKLGGFGKDAVSQDRKSVV